MKKNIFCALSIAFAVSMVLPSSIQAAKASKLNKKSITICIGDSEKLQMKNTKKSVVWKSNNKKIASITKNGKIKAKKSGNTKIIAKVGKKKYKCKITVKKQKLNKTSISLLVGENKKLKASGVSKRASINWVSTDNDVATVYDGEVVAIGKGTATIKAVMPEVFGKTLKCKVTVKENKNNEPDVDTSIENNEPNSNAQKPIDNTNKENDTSNKDNSQITIYPYASSSGSNGNSGSSNNGTSTTVVTNTNTISIIEKETIWYGNTKTYDISISGTTDIGTVTWSSSNEKILKVEQNGKAYGACPGTAILKATTSKGLSATINVEVLKIEYYTDREIGEKYNVKEYFSDIDIENLQWKSENTEVASINKDGIVTALKTGKTKIIGTLGSVACIELVINVYDNSSSPNVYLYIENPGTLSIGTTKLLTTSSSGIPSDAEIVWESSNPDIVTVNNNGELKALSGGEATITVYVNGKFMDSVTITVEEESKEKEVEAELVYNSQKTVVIGCSNKETATKITIPDGVKTIGVNAFYYMEKLKEVTMTDSVTEIDDSAFYNCSSLTNITLSKNIRRIGESAFMDCERIENIELPDTIEEIGNSCFFYCSNLASITIPNKITTISYDCFRYCTNLENIALSKNTTNIENFAFDSCMKLKNINIENVTYIGDYAFENCASLERIIIPDGITSKCTIDEYGWERVEKNIGDSVFYNCTNLKEVTISKNMEYIPNGIFMNCSLLKEIVLPEGTKKISESAFQSCTSLEKITIPATVTAIDDTAFQYCYSLSTICGKSGSYAEAWAKEKRYTFEIITK